MKACMVSDTLSYANRLKTAGLDPKIAETHAEANAEMVAVLLDNGLATKQDLRLTQSDLERKIIETKAELKQDIADVRQDMKTLENRLTLRLGGIVIGSMTLLTAILSFIHVSH